MRNLECVHGLRDIYKTHKTIKKVLRDAGIFSPPLEMFFLRELERIAREYESVNGNGAGTSQPG